MKNLKIEIGDIIYYKINDLCYMVTDVSETTFILKHYKMTYQYDKEELELDMKSGDAILYKKVNN